MRQRKGGVRFDVSVVAKGISLGFDQVAVYLIYRDITERKNVERELRRSEGYLAEAQRLMAWNVRTGALFWSQEVFRIYEYDPKEIGPTWPQFLERVHPDDRTRIQEKAKMEATAKELADSHTDFRIVRCVLGIFLIAGDAQYDSKNLCLVTFCKNIECRTVSLLSGANQSYVGCLNKGCISGFMCHDLHLSHLSEYLTFQLGRKPRIHPQTPVLARGHAVTDVRSAVLTSGFPFPADEQHKRGGPRTCHGRVIEAQINC